MNVMHIDVTRAHCYAKVSREVYVKLLVEHQTTAEEHVCGKFHRTRDATQNWQSMCSDTVREVGLEVGKVSPCHFYHKERSAWYDARRRLHLRGS